MKSISKHIHMCVFSTHLVNHQIWQKGARLFPGATQCYPEFYSNPSVYMSETGEGEERWGWRRGGERKGREGEKEGRGRGRESVFASFLELWLTIAQFFPTWT